MNPTEAYWNAVNSGANVEVLDELNAARIDHEMRETRERQLIDGHKVAILNVYCGLSVVEDADV